MDRLALRHGRLWQLLVRRLARLLLLRPLRRSVRRRSVPRRSLHRSEPGRLAPELLRHVLLPRAHLRRRLDPLPKLR